jgi:hypothetical protein
MISIVNEFWYIDVSKLYHLSFDTNKPAPHRKWSNVDKSSAKY